MSEEFDVAELFPTPARPRKRRAPRRPGLPAMPALPWYPIGHLTLAVVTAAVVWAGLPVGVEGVAPTVHAGATTVSAVVSMVVWARFGPLAAVAVTVVAGLLSFGAGMLALYAPLAVAVLAVAVVAGRTLARLRDGEK